MRTKFYSAWITLGLIATVLAKAGHAEGAAPTPSGVELVVDGSLYPTQLHFTLPKRASSIWNLDDVTAFGPGDFPELNLALASPGLLFGAPRDFFSFTLRFGSGATTAVVFPNRSK